MPFRDTFIVQVRFNWGAIAISLLVLVGFAVIAWLASREILN
jgi:heme exporter protein D